MGETAVKRFIMESSAPKITFGNGKEKILTVVLAIVGLIAIGFIIATIILGVKYTNKDTIDHSIPDKLNNETKINETFTICNTEECTKAAGDILKAMDKHVNPCDDFYQFTCGNWIKDHPIPDGASSWDQYSVMSVRMYRKIRGILETKLNESDPAPVNYAKVFYQSCIDQNATDQTELKELTETILKIGDVNRNIWLKLGELRRRTSGQYLISLDVELNEKNTSNYIIYLDQPSLGLNRAILTAVDHDHKKYYTEFIAAVWPLVYPDDKTLEPMMIAEKIVEFETQIAQLCTVNQTDPFNLLTLAQFEDSTGNAMVMNWEVYISEVFKDVVQSHNVDLGYLPNLTVVVRDLKYFKGFGQLLHSVNNDDPMVLENYLRWRVILTNGQDISTVLRNVFSEYIKKTQGMHLNPSPRWEICSDRTNSAFGMAISYHYVREVFSGNFKLQTAEMMEFIKSSVMSIVDQVSWIGNDGVRSKVRERVQKMTSFIGYPDWLVSNKTALDSYYRRLEFNPGATYFDNFLRISKWKNMEILKNVNKSKDNNKWLEDPTFVGAFYSLTYNSVGIPAGYLQPPFYFTGRPIQALNYGAIGTVIGHEISHGLELVIADGFSQQEEPQSNVNGSLVEWWDQKGTVIQHAIRADCFIKQYTKYMGLEAKNLTVDSLNTLGENIADNAGFHQAFKAYQSYIRKLGRSESKLPGLDYSPQQLFFIAYSQTFCGSYSAQGMESQILNDVHTPNHFRVKGVLDNSLEFADTWNCTRPDPKSVCRLW